MPESMLARFVLLPELKFERISFINKTAFYTYHATKCSDFEVCPKCANPSSKVHDRRKVKIKDEPLRGKQITLEIIKRRFRCPKCKYVFTEPVQGISKGFKSTQRFKAQILRDCENFSDLKTVAKMNTCGNKTVYRALYEMLELKQREQEKTEWGTTIGIDEHSFVRNKKRGHREFVTMFVDINHHKVREVALGKTAGEIKHAIAHIPGREKVKNVVMDMCAPYRMFVKDYFPNAQIIADKFHVLRLLTPAINARRKQITGDRRKNPVRKLLLKNGRNLDKKTKEILHEWLKGHTELREVYLFKEWMHQLYRTTKLKWAEKILTRMTDMMAKSKLPEIQTLRKTLMNWREEVLNYFKVRLTNGMVEGFNGKAKLVQRRAYGYKNFSNYRLRLLYVCR